MGTTNGHLHAHQSAHSPITWQDILQSHCTRPARHLLPCGHIPVSTRALVGTHKTSLQHNHVRWPRFPQVLTATAMGTTAPGSPQNSPLGKGDANYSKSSHLLCATLSAKARLLTCPVTGVNHSQTLCHCCFCLIRHLAATQSVSAASGAHLHNFRQWFSSHTNSPSQQ